MIGFWDVVWVTLLSITVVSLVLVLVVYGSVALAWVLRRARIGRRRSQ